MKLFLIFFLFTASMLAEELYDSYKLQKASEVTVTPLQTLNVKIRDKNESGVIVDPEANVTARFLKQNYFTSMVHYAPIFFDDEDMEGNASGILNEILEDINASDIKRSRISIVGHTAESKDVNKSVPTNWFVSFFQDVATYEGNDEEADKNLSIKRGQIVYDWFKDHNVSGKIMLVEGRGGKDKLYTEGVSEGREKNNRVEVTLYLIADSDHDGVLDPYDACPNTYPGLSVDKYGCSGSLRLDINFKFDSAEVDGEDNSSVRSFAEFLKKNPPYDAMIVGHTDEQGSAAYNEKLSLRRAETIVKMLISYGVDAKRLKAEGKGESEPVKSREMALKEKIKALENNTTAETSATNSTKKHKKPKKVRLTREERMAIDKLNRRIQAHYFLKPVPAVPKKRPKAPRLRYKAN